MKKALIAGAALAALTLTAVTGAQAQGIYFGVGASPYYDRDDYGYYRKRCLAPTLPSREACADDDR